MSLGMKGTSNSMPRRSHNRNFGAGAFTFADAKDFISMQKMRLEANPDKSVTESRVFDSLKYANQSPIVRSSSNAMYPFGTEPRFITPKAPTDVAFYADANAMIAPRAPAS